MTACKKSSWSVSDMTASSSEPTPFVLVAFVHFFMEWCGTLSYGWRQGVRATGARSRRLASTRKNLWQTSPTSPRFSTERGLNHCFVRPAGSRPRKLTGEEKRLSAG